MCSVSLKRLTVYVSFSLTNGSQSILLRVPTESAINLPRALPSSAMLHCKSNTDTTARSGQGSRRHGDDHSSRPSAKMIAFVNLAKLHRLVGTPFATCSRQPEPTPRDIRREGPRRRCSESCPGRRNTKDGGPRLAYELIRRSAPPAFHNAFAHSSVQNQTIDPFRRHRRRSCVRQLIDIA